MKKNNILELNKYICNAKFNFKVGQRLFNSGRLENALCFLKRSAELEPFNADYKFNLACLFSEIKQVRNSNNLLIEILKNIDPSYTECYFGIGCNYFEMGKLDKAREYFEKYLHFDPAGQYAYDAHDVLYYLDIYDDTRQYRSMKRKAGKLAEKGERLLEEGDIVKASQQLEKALEYYPGLIGPRIHLSGIYFGEGNKEKAISMAKSILSLDSGNIDAHCRLILYYAGGGNKRNYSKQIKVLETLQPKDEREWTLLLETCSALGEHTVYNRIAGKRRTKPEPITLLTPKIKKYKL